MNLYATQDREKDFPNQCKDRENGTGYADKRRFENCGIRHVQNQLPWPADHSCMVQTARSSDWEGE